MILENQAKYIINRILLKNMAQLPSNKTINLKPIRCTHGKKLQQKK
jgi:hypothetical protein